MYQYPIKAFIEIINRSKQSVFEYCIKMCGINHQVWVRFQVLDTASFSSTEQPQFVNYISVKHPEAFPLRPLLLVGGNCRVEAFRQTIKRYAVVGGNDKLLFQPELLLELFKLGKKGDQIESNGAQGLNHAQAFFDVGKLFSILHVIKMHHFVLDVEVKFTTEKAA